MPWRKSTLSLTARLTLWYTLSSVAVVLTATLYLYFSWINALATRDAGFLYVRVDAARALLDQKDDNRALKNRIEKEWPAISSEVFHVRILDDKGRIVAQTPNTSRLFRQLRMPPPLAYEMDDTHASQIIRLEGQVFRAISALISMEGRNYVMQVVLDRTNETIVLQEYRYRLFVVLAICLVA